MSEQAKMHTLQTKIRNIRHGAVIWFFLTVLFFLMTVTCLSVCVIVSIDAPFTLLRMLRVDLIAIGFGGLGIVEQLFAGIEQSLLTIRRKNT